MTSRPVCKDHQPQTEGFPWEHPKGLVTWCKNCGALEMDGQFMGRAVPDPKGGPMDWLFAPVVPLNWISLKLNLEGGKPLTDQDLEEVVQEVMDGKED